MLKATIICGLGVMAIGAGSLACGKKLAAPVPEELQKQIALGESLFNQRDCRKCHMPGDNPPEIKAPPLTSVFLVADTILIKYQLAHLRGDKMPLFELRPQELSAITQYVASLHAQANTLPNLTNPDTRCPVCGALVHKATALKNSLETSHNGRFFYFECLDCQKVFLSDAAWYAQSGYVRDEQK